jgi:serine O-acetyltransferase
MRPVLVVDVLALARVLSAGPGTERHERALRLVEQTEAADRFRRQRGASHPAWGDGTVCSRCLLTRPPPEPGQDDPVHLEAIAAAALVLARVLRERSASNGIGLTRGSLIYCGQGRCSQELEMGETRKKVASVDPVWRRVCDEAVEAIANEPLLGGLVHSSLLHHPTMERALAYRFSLKLASGEMSEQILRELADEAYEADPELGVAARSDLMAVYDRDPACHRFIQPLLFFKGYKAVQAYRVGHWLWRTGRRDLAYFVQMRVSEVFGVDIHPAARVGKGIMIDHAHSIVIGETAVVGDNVSMLHSVTLGGTGKEDGDRHPKIEDGVMIGAGAKILGNITVGHCSRIAAGSVVLHDVPHNTTVAGVPARVVGVAGCDQPSQTMDQLLRGEI